MREILFRGKTVKEEWVYGLLSHVGNAWYISNKSGTPLAYEVIPSTVGQYTGLTDKNGKKIFEGDIITIEKCTIEKCVERYIGVVKYGDFTPKLYAYRIYHSYQIKGFYVEILNGQQLVIPSNINTKIIGNIHDNLELLYGCKTIMEDELPDTFLKQLKKRVNKGR